MDGLPADVLAGVLRRLAARDLAACRCVRKEWRDAIDAGELLAALLRDLLPRSLRGIFVNYGEYANSHLFSRRTPGAQPKVDGTLEFMPGKKWRWRAVVDHCNGLLLYHDKDNCQYHVCNPATRRWQRLPSPRQGFSAAYLVFDPAVSLHYEVFLLPRVPEEDRIQEALGFLSRYFDTSVKCSSEWPPARYKIEVFSSRSGQWVERQFVREGNAVATLADVVSERKEPIGIGFGPQQRYAEYWRGALYIHCRGSFLARLSLSDNMYKVVKTPTMTKMNKGNDTNDEFNNLIQPYLGRSEKGVYFVVIQKHQLCIWTLNESERLMEWELNYHVDLVPLSQKIGAIWCYDEQIKAPWFLEDYDRNNKAIFNGETNVDIEKDQENSDDSSDSEDEGEKESEESTDGNSDGECDEDDEEVRQQRVEWNVDNYDTDSLETSEYSDDDGEGKGNVEERKELSEWNSDHDYSLDLEKDSINQYIESFDLSS